MPHSHCVSAYACTCVAAHAHTVVIEHIDLYGDTHTLQLCMATCSVSTSVQMNVFDYNVYMHSCGAMHVYVCIHRCTYTV